MLITTLLFAAGAAAQLQLSLSRPQQPHDAVANRKRQVDTDLKRPIDLYSWYYPYAVDVTVGTPEQPQSLALTFAYPASFVLNQTICRTPPDDEDYNWYYDNNCASGAYNASKSTSYTREGVELSDYQLYLYEGNEFYDIYASRPAAGSLMNETVHVGGAEVTSVLLGLVNNTVLTTGFMGLGYSYDDEDGNLLNQLTNQGVIGSRAFSLWADDQGNNVTGSILFGAVDRSRYTGKLQRLQASAYKDGPSSGVPGYAVNVTAAENHDGNSLTSYFENFYASISPTTMITNLPQEVAEPIWEMANASYRSHWQGYAVDCNATISGSFTLELGGAGGYRLEVDVRDLVLSPETWWEKEAWNLDEDREAITWCYFGVQSTEYTPNFNHDTIEPWVIGNLALKDTYMAFDVENMEVGLAPLKSDLSGDSDIQAFELGDMMPDSEFVGYKECFSSWGCYDDDSNNGGSGDYDDYSDAYNEYMSHWRRQAAIITGAVVGVVAAIVLGLSIWAILRCRRIREAEAAAASKAEGLSDSPRGSVPVAEVPRPAYTTQRLPVVPEDGVPRDATRQTAEPGPANTDDGTAQTVSPMSTPREPEATLAREAPTASNQGEK